MASENKAAGPKDIRMSTQQATELYRAQSEQLREIVNAIGQMGSVQAEIRTAKKVIEEVHKQKNPKVMVPLGGGVMAEALVTDNNRFKIPMAGGVVVERTAEQALADMNRAEEETKKQVKELEAQRKTASENIQGLQKVLMKIQQAQQRK